MSSWKWVVLAVALAACVAASACSDYNTNLSIQTSSSVLTFVSPSSIPAGNQGFTITANGSGFVTGALILWNGKPLTTTLVSSIQLTAPVPASDLTSPGTVQISIQIPGSAQSATQNVYNTTTTEISNVVLFTINPAPATAPSISSVSASTTSAPSTPSCAAQGFTLTVNGANFTSDAAVNWNGSPQPTTFGSATQLTAAIPASLIAFPGTATVTVTNSAGTSAAKSFTVSSAAGALGTPTLGALSQTSNAAGSSALTVTITGTNFAPCSTAQWVSPSSVTSALATTFVSSTQLTANIPASDFLAAGTANVNVQNPGSGGGTSGSIPFTIVAPAITSVSSSSSSVMNSIPSCTTTGFTLTVIGTNFVNGSVVEWNGSPRPTTFASATQLSAAISAADIVSAGTASITVSSAGVASNALPFTISAATLATPTISAIAPGVATAGTAGISLVVTGTNFVPCSSVQWTDPSSNKTQFATTYVSSTQLSATVPAANLTTVETVQVAVASPAASANVSNAVAFPIALPTITSLSASSTSSNSTPECAPTGITLTVNGTNFVPNGLTVNWNGSPRSTTFVSATQLTAAISAPDTAFAGPVSVTVSSTTLPLLASNASAFTIAASTAPLATPVITQLSPSSVFAGSGALTLGVTGSSAANSGFLPCSVVDWNGSPRSTVFAGPTGLNAAILAGDVASATSVPVTVFTLTDGGGGGASNALTFTIFPTPPAPTARIAPAVQAAGEVVSTGSQPPALAAATMSADKRYTVNVLASSDGATEIPEGIENVFVRDTCAGATAGCQPSVTLVSIGVGTNPADGSSISPSISADGRYVAFLSTARNLVAGDTNGAADVFIRDTCAGATSACTPSTQRVSVAADGTQLTAASVSATISATGRFITFETAPAPGGAGSPAGLYVRDTCANTATACTPTTQQLQ